MKRNSAQRILLYTGVAYAVFVVYGSLVPLQFHPRPFSEAWSHFLNIRYLRLGIASRADWMANILLFIPLSFLWLGIFWRSRGLGARLSISAGVWGACLTMGVAIEFTQLFFPPRTVSLNDILAEGVGTTIGVTAWWAVGPRLLAWLDEWKSIQGVPSLAERFLWAYLGLVIFYNVMPLDLTISPVELYHKWKAGRIVLIPLGFHVADPVQRIYDVATDAIIWLPVTALWVLSEKKRAFEAWLWTVVAATILEGLQLFVYTRVSDITDIIAAAVGGAAGAWFGSKLRWHYLPKRTRPVITSRFGRVLFGTGGFFLWVLVLGGVFWYPFDFTADRVFLLERLHMFKKVPFHSYYVGTEYRALTEVFHKVLFFSPLGVTLGFATLRRRPLGARRLAGIGAMLLIGVVASGIELGQVLLPQKYPDSTDVILETCGGALGYWGVMMVHSRLRSGLPQDAR